MNYTELKNDLFAALAVKTSWGRNELKEIIHQTFQAAADKELEMYANSTELSSSYDGDNTPPSYDGDNRLPWD